MKKLLILLSIFLIFSYCLLPKIYPQADNLTSEIVIEKISGRILYEKNANAKKYMASTTKILTAICAIENTELDIKRQIKKEWCGVEGSSIYLREGEKLTVRELLYGLMLRSGNDSAVAIANITSGSVQAFSSLMNMTAKKAGALNSNFVNPHGLHDDNHYTTAYDLALITRYAMQNEIFREIVGTKQIKISNDGFDYPRVLINKNKLLNEYNGCTGVKTGYTKKAGRCLVSSAKVDNFEVICVVLNCSPMFERSKELFDFAFNNYQLKKIVCSNDVYDFVCIDNSDERCGVKVSKDLYVPLKNDGSENYKIVNNYSLILKKPIKENEIVGEILVYVENDLIFFEKIYTICNID